MGPKTGGRPERRPPQKNQSRGRQSHRPAKKSKIAADAFHAGGNCAPLRSLKYPQKKTEIHRHHYSLVMPRFTGTKHVRFGADGKVIFHHDYFDGAALLYEKIPVLRGMIRFVKKRV